MFTDLLIHNSKLKIKNSIRFVIFYPSDLREFVSYFTYFPLRLWPYALRLFFVNPVK